MDNYEMINERLTPRNEEKDKKLDEICLYILSNYDSLLFELSSINKVLNAAEKHSISFVNKSTLVWNVQNEEKNIDIVHLKKITEELSKIDEEVKLEFLGGLDLLNVSKEIQNKSDRGKVIVFVWKAREVVNNMVYQIKRMKNIANKNKQIAILKGMIAYS